MDESTSFHTSAIDDILAGRLPYKAPETTPSDWKNFKPPPQLPINHPWISRYCPSALLYFDNGPTGSNTISTANQEVYVNWDYPVRFLFGGGSAGYTGVFKALCERYIDLNGGGFSIGMVRNHSRHTQAALLADVVQVAFTQEPHNEDLAINEGWCTRACRVLNDHFILIGPSSNPAGIDIGNSTLNQALQTMTSRGKDQTYNQMLFHSNGDGSSTFFKKQQLWIAAGIDVSNARWAKSYGLSPYEALRKVAEESAYLLTDRATYLTAKHHGLVPRLRVCAEGDRDLLNPCSALLNTKTGHEAAKAAAEFARWLEGDEAQEIIRSYGMDWSYRKPLFTVAAQEEFEEEFLLAGRL